MKKIVCFLTLLFNTDFVSVIKAANSLPPTGDDSPVFLIVGVMAAVALVGVFFLLFGKKKKTEDKKKEENQKKK